MRRKRRASVEAGQETHSDDFCLQKGLLMSPCLKFHTNRGGFCLLQLFGKIQKYRLSNQMLEQILEETGAPLPVLEWQEV